MELFNKLACMDMVFNWADIHGSWVMDVSSAFGQSEAEERANGPLFATLPPTAIPGKEKWHVIRVRVPVYRLVNAPASWRRTVRRTLISLGVKLDPLPALPAVCARRTSASPGGQGCAGLVLLDVDDFLKKE